MVRYGYPEVVIPQIASTADISAVYTHEEACSEERDLDASVKYALQRVVKAPAASVAGAAGIEAAASPKAEPSGGPARPSPVALVQLWGNTLYHIDDLPMDARIPGEVPPVYTSFRKLAEKNCKVRAPLAAPSAGDLRPGPDGIERLATGAVGHTGEIERAVAAGSGGWGGLPSLEQLGVGLLPGMQLQGSEAVGASDARAPLEAAAGESKVEAVTGLLPSGPSADSLVAAGWRDRRSVLPFEGGETAGLARLRGWIWEGDHLKEYKETRNGMVGGEYSSKFSPWLAFGCLSPRLIHAEVRRYERERVENTSTYWLLFELIWRDFFRFSSIAWGSSLFQLSGPRDADLSKSPRLWKRDPALFRAWAQGKTGYPFVDANMRELLQSGFMSNRGRQNVASFFIKDMEMDWRLGAEWFEALLIDHDPGANYGNWTYQAGVGSDPREDRYFLIPKQSRQYDGKGAFMRHWLSKETAGWSQSDLH